VVQELLERLGFSVAVAENGGQALAKLETEVFDAVLMDIHMLVMDGLETTRRIRQDGRFAALPVSPCRPRSWPAIRQRAQRPA
jgi:CheY-like chemotaxis protein